MNMEKIRTHRVRRVVAHTALAVFGFGSATMLNAGAASAMDDEKSDCSQAEAVAAWLDCVFGGGGGGGSTGGTTGGSTGGSTGGTTGWGSDSPDAGFIENYKYALYEMTVDTFYDPFVEHTVEKNPPDDRDCTDCP